MKAFCSAGSLANAEKVDIGGALMLNEKGMPVGAVPANSPANENVYYINSKTMSMGFARIWHT